VSAYALATGSSNNKRLARTAKGCHSAELASPRAILEGAHSRASRVDEEFKQGGFGRRAPIGSNLIEAP
jgi:hypothetical protein